MISDFTDYVRSLGTDGTPPDPTTYEAAREMLRGELVREMMRRGLWSRPPGYLGLPGGDRWTSELIDELVSDCYGEIFLHRLRMLKNQLLVWPNVNGLVLRCARNFLHDRRRESDPLGYQIYEILDACLGRLRAAGTLCGGSPDAAKPGRARNATLFMFSSTSPVPSEGLEVDLGPVVRRWNAELWPDLMKAQGRARRRVLSRLDELVAGLPKEGIEAFRFQDLIEPMKSDLRSRWYEEMVAQAEHTASQTDPREDLGFRKLRDCVRRELDASPAAERESLLRLWELLWSYAAGESDDRVAEKAERSGKAPTDLGLAKALGLPRYRVARHKETLGRLIEICQSSTRGAPRKIAAADEERGGRGVLATIEEGHAVDTTSRTEHLRRATGRVAARVEGSAGSAEEEAGSGRQPEPGDVFVLPTHSDLLLEWVILEVDRQAGRVWVIPGDDRPWIGSRDVAVDPRTAPGMTAVRPSLGAWIAAGRLEKGGRTARLPASLVEEARRKSSASADLAASPDEIAADEDFEYRRWLEEVAEVLSRLEEPERQLPAPHAPSSDRSSRRLPRVFGAVAATLLVALGLGAWGWGYHRREMADLERRLLTHPPTVLSDVSLALLRPRSVRGEPQLHEVPERIAFLHLILPVDAGDPGPFDLRILEGERRVWQGRLSPGVRAEVGVVISRRLMTDGDYLVHLSRAEDGEPLATYALRIQAGDAR